MAVAMEVAWRGSELGSPVFDMKKKRAWGADAQKVVQLMMGQLQSESKPVEVTLDLLGKADPSTTRVESENLGISEFLELDPDQPLPSGWEKCLDLKAGKVYFVNKSMGISTNDDPRKQQHPAVELASPSPLAHEFLGSKKSETLREESLKASSSSSSGGTPQGSKEPQMLSFSTGTQLWKLQLADDMKVSLVTDALEEEEEGSNLELNLNLAAGPSQQQQEQSVCTVEMVQKALRRTEKAMGKREMPVKKEPKHSGSSSFSSLTSARSEPSWSHASPSTSSSSSTSSRSSLLAGFQGPGLEDLRGRKTGIPGGCEAESKKSETTNSLVMGACTRCLMYCMLFKSDPRCPRCGSDAPLDFGAPPSKRQRFELDGLEQRS